MPKKLSTGEELLATHLSINGIPYEREVRCIPGRRFRCDFLIGENLVAEVDGGTWIQGRHNRGSSIEKDYEKLNALVAHGFSVLRFTTQMVTDGRAIETITQLLSAPTEGRKHGD